MLLDTRCGVGFVVGSKAVFKSDLSIISNKKVVNEWLDRPEISDARVDKKKTSSTHKIYLSLSCRSRNNVHFNGL